MWGVEDRDAFIYTGQTNNAANDQAFMSRDGFGCPGRTDVRCDVVVSIPHDISYYNVIACSLGGGAVSSQLLTTWYVDFPRYFYFYS